MPITTQSTAFKVSESDIRRLLEQGRHRYWRQMNAPQLQRLLDEIAAWPAPPAPDPHPQRSLQGQKAQWLAGFLAHSIETGGQRIETLQNRHGDFVQRYSRAISTTQQRRYLLDYALDLGANPLQLAGDERAFARWFDYDAVNDRYARRLRANERDLCLRMDCLGQIAALVLNDDGDVIGHPRLWQRLSLEPLLTPWFHYQGDGRVISQAFRCLATALQAMPREHQQQCLEQNAQVFVFHTALAPQRDVWLQCAALELLQSLAPASFVTAVGKRLTQTHPDDDLFVRRRAVLLLGANLLHLPQLAELLPTIAQDPSPYVRQALCSVLVQAGLAETNRYLPALLSQDPAPEVRAAAVLSLCEHVQADNARVSACLDWLVAALAQESADFVLRAALTCAERVSDWLVLQHPALLPVWHAALQPALQALHVQAPSAAVRRWAAQTLERLWCDADAEARRLKQLWRVFLDQVPSGATRRIPRPLLAAEPTLGRVLALLAQDGFGLDVELGKHSGYVTRGPLFGFRWWRLLHELRHPSPDKRQAFSHCVGRLFYGNLHAPSARLAELAETKVPGEPLFMADEQGWRPYLPLPDEVLSCVAQNQATRIYSAEGVTEIKPPSNPLRRWTAHRRLSWRYAEYARLRNFSERGAEHPQAYLTALARLGVAVSLRGYGEGPITDPAVRRFFPAVLALPNIPWEALWERFQEYFVSVYENTLYDLSLYLSAAIAWFFGKHIYRYRQIRRARRRLPLCVGGWGTRGKSGTERLKAALFNALGYAIVSKTTGCEAMFLHAHAFGPLREMFLFRPYDKATIWEQHNLVLFADAIRSEVFLWECMALTPSYVRLLQRQWMRDDIASLTNAYPDHEDIQGPAGINIPQVMTQFVPENAVLLTSEEQMLPLFEEEARRVGTRVHAVGWLEAGLLPGDVLARFPYDEHPFNIALVLALARELQVPEDFALKELADRVVPDLGVLKTFPAAPWRSRRLEFINGMSANERFGCLGNWRRMGLDKADHELDPATWITVVVNNRADRIARSQVFAGVVVQDLSCDRIVLIGNNLNGLLGYIQDVWQQWVAAQEPGQGQTRAQKPTDHGASTAPDHESRRVLAEKQRLLESTRAIDQFPSPLPSPEGRGSEGCRAFKLTQLARWLRLPYTATLVQARLSAMLAGQNTLDEAARVELSALWEQPEPLRHKLTELRLPQAEEIAAFHAQNLEQYRQYQALLANPEQTTAQALREQLWRWYQAKLVVVWDYNATGDKVIEHIADACPPGFYNRIMGVQNIKGTGLDFVYRWQAWEKCRHACRQLDSRQAQVFAQGLRDLATFSDYGVLCEETVRATVAQAQTSQPAQQERYQAELKRVLINLEQGLAKVREKMSSRPVRHWLENVADGLEAFLDAGDAVQRRKQADRIYRDLIDERISHERAALELQSLNKRQKGHWLFNQVRKRLDKQR